LPAALAQRVLDLPSTAFFAAQQPLADDAVTGRLRDSSTVAPGTAAGWPAVVLAMAAPVSATVVASTVHASTATPFVRALIGPPGSAKVFIDLHM
jgi:hypothetical protein